MTKGEGEAESESIQGGRAIREAEQLQKHDPQEGARPGGRNLQDPGVKCGGAGGEKVERGGMLVVCGGVGEVGQDVLQGSCRMIGSVLPTLGPFYLFSSGGVNNGVHTEGSPCEMRQSRDNLRSREKPLNCRDAPAFLQESSRRRC